MERLERRVYARQGIDLKVYVSPEGHPAERYKATNISSRGLFLEGWSPALPRGAVTLLVFALELGGNLVKLRRRWAMVAHVTQSGSGLLLYREKPERSRKEQLRSM